MLRKILISTAAASAAILASAGAASAASGPAPDVTGPNVTSQGQTGYMANGAQFQVVQGTVYLRAPGQYAAELQGAGGSVSLWASNGTVVQLGISASTSPASGYSAGVAPFTAAHTQITTGISEQGNASFPAGESVHLRMAYDRVSGLVNMTESDATHTFRATFSAGTGLSYSRAEVSSDFGITPWDSAGYVAAPPAQMKYLSWTAASLTNYKGKTSTFWSYFTHHKLVLVGAPGGAVPSALTDGGSVFGTFLTP